MLMVVVLGTVGMAAARAEESLPRRAFMGARLGAVPEDLRASLPEHEGVLVQQVLPESSALAAGLQANDIVLRIGGEPVERPRAIVDLVGRHRVGDRLDVDYVREGERRTLTLTVRPFPEERYDGIDVRYDQVQAEGGLLRSIVTRPAAAEGLAPALYILQGYDCGSIDLPFAPDGDLARLVRHFSGLGYVTYRVEKSGVGDSRGEACTEAGFHTETDGFLRGLRRLKRYDFVEPDRVFLLGLSMGGVWAPILASQEPVAGIMVYGTIGKPWVEYMEENGRRQELLEGRDYDAIEQGLKEGLAMWHYLLTERLSPSQIIERHPDLRERVAAQSSDPEGATIEHFYGRHYRFIQELSEINLAARWQAVEAPVLAMWGRGDYVSSRGDHQLVVDIVNRYHPGHATLVEVDADHWFDTATSFAESYARKRAGEPGIFNEAVLAELQGWLARQRVAGT